MIKRYIVIIFFGMLFLLPLSSQEEAANIKRGNRNYEKGEYVDAEVDYRRGIDKNIRSFEAHYNLGNSLFKQNKYSEAGQSYLKATTLIDPKDPKTDEKQKMKLAHAFHNLGNACFGVQQYMGAVEAYKQSLRLNPKDDETRYNLVKAMQMLEQQQAQPQQQQQDQQQEQQQQEQQQEQQQAQEQEEQMKQAQAQETEDNDEMDKETAEQILSALEQDEEKTQEKLQQQHGAQKRVEKNW